MEGTCHEGIVVGCVAEDNEFCAAEGIAVRSALRCPLDDTAHQADGVHVDPGLCGADVNTGADDISLSQGIGDGLDQHAVGRGHSLGDQGGIAAQEVYAYLFGGAVQGLGDRYKIITAAAGAGSGNGYGCDRNTLIYNRNAVLSGDLLTCADQVAGAGRDLIIDFRAQAAQIGVRAVEQADAHRDRADIEVLPVDHCIGFGYF